MYAFQTHTYHQEGKNKKSSNNNNSWKFELNNIRYGLYHCLVLSLIYIILIDTYNNYKVHDVTRYIEIFNQYNKARYNSIIVNDFSILTVTNCAWPTRDPSACSIDPRLLSTLLLNTCLLQYYLTLICFIFAGGGDADDAHLSSHSWSTHPLFQHFRFINIFIIHVANCTVTVYKSGPIFNNQHYMYYWLLHYYYIWYILCRYTFIDRDCI